MNNDEIYGYINKNFNAIINDSDLANADKLTEDYKRNYYKDKLNEEKVIMRRKEDQYLRLFKQRST